MTTLQTHEMKDLHAKSIPLVGHFINYGYFRSQESNIRQMFIVTYWLQRYKFHFTTN